MPDSSGQVLFLCTANTCRSPMAAALVQHALAAEPEPLHSVKILSAGVSALDGYPPSANSAQALRKVGITLNNHRSKRVTQEMLDASLAAFCMTEAHRAMLELQYDTSRTQVLLMRELLDTAERDIPDPFGSNLQAYEACRDSMVEAIPAILSYLRGILAQKPS
ncbi:MAG TPA: low molecular weight protein arginine phosphatase [Opitutaceae bacterium]